MDVIFGMGSAPGGAPSNIRRLAGRSRPKAAQAIRKLTRLAVSASAGLLDGSSPKDSKIEAMIQVSEKVTVLMIARGVAYSTYDIEDVLKAKFLTPLDLFCLDDEVYGNALRTTNKRVQKVYSDETVKHADLINVLFVQFSDLFELNQEMDELDATTLAAPPRPSRHRPCPKPLLGT